MVTPADREADQKARQSGEALALAAFDRGDALTDADVFDSLVLRVASAIA